MKFIALPKTSTLTLRKNAREITIYCEEHGRALARHILMPEILCDWTKRALREVIGGQIGIAVNPLNSNKDRVSSARLCLDFLKPRPAAIGDREGGGIEPYLQSLLDKDVAAKARKARALDTIASKIPITVIEHEAAE